MLQVLHSSLSRKICHLAHKNKMATDIPNKGSIYYSKIWVMKRLIDSVRPTSKPTGHDCNSKLSSWKTEILLFLIHVPFCAMPKLRPRWLLVYLATTRKNLCLKARPLKKQELVQCHHKCNDANKCTHMSQ
jgi:hypothetical protein